MRGKLAAVFVCGLLVLGASTTSAGPPPGWSVWESIWVGQDKLAGSFAIYEEDDALKLLIWPRGNCWRISEAHAHIAYDSPLDPNTTWPVNRGGNPKIGKFMEALKTDDSLYELELPYTGEKPAYIAVHVVMVNECNGREETGWGGPCVWWVNNFDWEPRTSPPDDSGFYEWPGSRWGWYFEYPLPPKPQVP